MIGMGVWLCSIGRFDIAYAISSLSRFSSAPSNGHFDALVRVFQYINKFPDKRLRVDATDPKLQGECIIPKNADFTQQYLDAVEGMDQKVPSPRGTSLSTSVWFDSDHAHDKVTCRSITGMFVFVGSLPILWKEKRQGAIQSSTYGAEFSAGRTAVEEAGAIRYLLRSLGVPAVGPTPIYGDCMGMIQSCSIPEGTPKKKHGTISYHTVREMVASGAVVTYKVDTKDNLADLLTKALPAAVPLPPIQTDLAKTSPFCIIRRMKGSDRRQFTILRVTTRDGYGWWYTGFQVYYR